jgi:Fe-S-cluster formation regulator IscX/YfhJ
VDHFVRVRSLHYQLTCVLFVAAATLALGLASTTTAPAGAFDTERAIPSVAAGSLCFEGRCYTHRMHVYDPQHAVVVIETELITQTGVFLASCTGALLDSGRHVLTAAHCITEDDVSTRIGNVVVRVWGAAAELHAHNVSVHAGWLSADAHHTDYDIAVIELRDRVWWLDGYTIDGVDRHEGVLEAWSAQWIDESTTEPTIIRCSIAATTVGWRNGHLSAPCSFRPGGSGGPLFSIGDETRIVGVLHAYDDHDVNYWSMLESADSLWTNLVDVPFGAS